MLTSRQFVTRPFHMRTPESGDSTMFVVALAPTRRLRQAEPVDVCDALLVDLWMRPRASVPATAELEELIETTYQ